MPTSTLRVTLSSIVVGALLASASPCAVARAQCVAPDALLVVEPAAPSVEPHPAPPTEPPVDAARFEPTLAYEYGGLVDRVDLGGLGFTFDSPDGVASIVRDLRVDLADAGDARVTLGGVSLALSGRPQPWVRGPELRVSLSGGDFGGRAFAPAGGPSDVSLALGSVFALRLEGAFGVQHRFGPVALFALGRVGWGAYFVSARTQEARLGDLGQETLSAHYAELGATVGVSVLLGGAWRLEAAWRRTFTGATGDGLLVGMTTELVAGE